MTDIADLVITNAKAITFDNTRPDAQAVAVRGNTILHVGPARDMDALTGPQTRVVDAGGASILPGIVESHMHLFPGAVDMDNLNLHGVRGIEALTAAAREFAGQQSGQGLVFAVQTDYNITGSGEHPTRQFLDCVLPDRPLALMAPDYHTVWANTLALEQAGLLQGAKLPSGSEVVMGEDGKAHGELREFDAFRPIIQMKPTAGREAIGFLANGADSGQITAQQRELDKSVLRRGLEYCASNGITTIHNMDGNFYQLELLEELRQSGELLCRTQIPFYANNEVGIGDLQKAVKMRARYDTPMLWSNRVKIFMDGVLESGTAYLLEPYSNRPGNTGSAIFTDEHFREIAIEADRLGLQISVHAIGDAAVRRTLDGYQAAREANGARDSRHRIEHIEVIDPVDLPRLAELGVIASMQPLHAPGAGLFAPGPIIDALGEARMIYSCPWQSLKNTGARLIFSSDWPVVQLEPMDSLKAAVIREQVVTGAPDQRQRLRDAIAAYTCDGAWTDFSESVKGRLMAGMYADLVLLSEDIEHIDPSELDCVKPVLTVCDGKITHDLLNQQTR